MKTRKSTNKSGGKVAKTATAKAASNTAANDILAAYDRLIMATAERSDTSIVRPVETSDTSRRQRFHPDTPFVKALVRLTVAFMAEQIKAGQGMIAAEVVGAKFGAVLVTLNDPGPVELFPAAHFPPSAIKRAAEEVSQGFAFMPAPTVEEADVRAMEDTFVACALQVDDPCPVLTAKIDELDAATVRIVSDVFYSDRTEKNKPVKDSQKNIATFLEANFITLHYDTFLGKRVVTTALRNGSAKVELLNDDERTELWRRICETECSPGKVYFNDTLDALAGQSRKNTVADYLDSVEPTWDGKSRIERVFIDYAGVEDTPLHRAWGKAFMLTMVRRVRRPGSELYGSPILEGPRGGEGKSSFCRALVGDDWFTDCLKLGSGPKETIEQTQGKWLIEYSELIGLAKQDFEDVKGSLSRLADNARLAYGREASNRPRQFGMVGTTNQERYLRDEGGLRRFWPMRTKEDAADIPALKRDRHQLWAEASALEKMAADTNVPAEMFPLEREARKSRILQRQSTEEALPSFEGIADGVLPSSEVKAYYEFIGAKDDFFRHNGEIAKMLGSLGFENRKIKVPGGRGAQVRVWVKGGNRNRWYKFASPTNESDVPRFVVDVLRSKASDVEDETPTGDNVLVLVAGKNINGSGASVSINKEVM